ncbi:MAG: MATE family efflux transporter [Bacillota bacterium]
MDHSKQLGESKVSELLLKFSIPAIVGMMVNALYNVVDRIFIGRGVGSLGIAGITIGFPIMIVMMAFGMLIGIGATSLISIRLGERKKEEAELIAGNAMVLLILISLGISVLGLIFIDPLLLRFGASEAVLPYAKDYLTIILFGAVFQGIGFGMNNFIRAEGNPKIAMVTMMIGAILNTILDPIFIFLLGMGIKGAAYATILSQAVSALWVLHYFFGGKSMLKIHVQNLKLQMSIVLNIFAIGSAPFAMQIAASVLTIILNKSLQYYGGDVAISAMGIINSIVLLILMPIFGINQGSQPIIGYNYGAQKFDRVKEALKLAIMAATVIVTIGFIGTRLFPEQLIRLFNDKDPELIAFGAKGLKMFLLCLPIIGFQIVSSNYFQAVGKPKQSMFLSLSRQVLILIPAILILPRYFGLDGILMAGPAADFLSSLLTGTWLYMELKQLDQKHSENINLTPRLEE